MPLLIGVSLVGLVAVWLHRPEEARNAASRVFPWLLLGSLTLVALIVCGGMP